MGSPFNSQMTSNPEKPSALKEWLSKDNKQGLLILFRSGPFFPDVCHRENTRVCTSSPAMELGSQNLDFPPPHTFLNLRTQQIICQLKLLQPTNLESQSLAVLIIWKLSSSNQLLANSIKYDSKKSCLHHGSMQRRCEQRQGCSRNLKKMTYL
jgi:hypothetical protein